MPKLNVQQNNQNVIQAFKNALAIGNLKGIIASDGNHNFSTAGSNRNLLDNPWFTVNQRGFTSSTEVNGLRIVDRWFINNGGGTVTLTSNGLSVDNTQGTRYNTLQEIFGSGDWLAGKTVTLSINDGGTIYHRTFVIPARTSGYQSLLNWSWKAGVQLRFYVLPTTDQGAYNVQIYCPNGASSYKYELRSIKLELGSVSTLANDAPPDYWQELDHCKWYFERIKAQTTYSSFGNGFGETTTSGQMQVPMHPKRTATYTVSTNGSFTLYNGAQSRPVSALSKATSGLGQNVLCLAATATSLVQGSMYALLANNDASAYIDISADLQ